MPRPASKTLVLERQTTSIRFRFLSKDFLLRLQSKDFKIRLRRILRDATLSRRRTTIREETYSTDPWPSSTPQSPFSTSSTQPCSKTYLTCTLFPSFTPHLTYLYQRLPLHHKTQGKRVLYNKYL
ncbi:hypothetical protein GGP41_005964 [Bipolaris sorokiniana]|uniref:Uncharacterized protein n=1 Tax=Cochliobolus sativus TaxID=45130 RepID=A0A8H5ZH23_COCSA|nr:hypothetical protein GGP41_005964 [Bipolaris sorokiniana]